MDIKKLFIEELNYNPAFAPLAIPDVSDKEKIIDIQIAFEKYGVNIILVRLQNLFRTLEEEIIKKLKRDYPDSAFLITDANESVINLYTIKLTEDKKEKIKKLTYDTLNQKTRLFKEKIRFFEVSEDITGRLSLKEKIEKGDTENVTKKFFTEFQKYHDLFLKFIQGIPLENDRKWYASVLLNRLMFIYFIQKKGFIDNNPDYLKDKFEQIKANGKNYYKDFLLPLFFDGFAKKDSAFKKEFGKVPYLNGGLFLPHEIERKYSEPTKEAFEKNEINIQSVQITIENDVFEELINYFDRWNWYLDDRPGEDENGIDPDILGYIFEKYINQKDMGAYYTKEDITEYISKNTIIPFIFETAQHRCRSAFEGEQSVWRPLKADFDRYIYPAVKKGVELALPPEIAAGLNDVSKRTGWNKPAPEEYALPTEIWREVVARRKRCEDVRTKMLNGELQSINDLITYNLDICRFAQDVIENCESPDLLRAFYHAIERVTVLDPTCGSGAFLFAALNILEPLYSACLDRMQVFLDELDRSEEKHRPEKFSDFRKVLAEVEKHPNARYFILKSIIVNNLFGVDIMDEAVEICKLRLFLKLVAQVKSVDRIEPLPDIDFNIRAGNTLIGFATYDEVKKAVTSEMGGQVKLLFDDTMQRIDEKAQDVDRLFGLFRQQQTELGGEVAPDDKQELRRRLKALEDELNQYLAKEYRVDVNNQTGYQKWLASYKPFHWFIEFYGILKQGGFDVIIGNPPYVEYSKVRQEYTVRGYETEECGNLYAFVIERCVDILRTTGRLGMIVQLPIVCTDRMKPLQKECLDQSDTIWFANFDDRPAKLFDGLQHIRASIFTLQKGKAKTSNVHSTTYNRWYTEARQPLFELLYFESVSDYLMSGAIPKIGHPVAKEVRKRIAEFAPLGKYLITTTKHPTYFHNSPQYWIRAMTFVPYFWNERGGKQISTHVKSLYSTSNLDASVVAAVLNSSLFYWWFILLSNCRDLVMREIETFPIGLEQMSEDNKTKLAELTSQLMADYKRHAVRKETEYQATGRVVYDEFYPRHSKPIIDEIDRVLAKHYGFTDEELDFIINYDIKYRMGKESLEERE